MSDKENKVLTAKEVALYAEDRICNGLNRAKDLRQISHKIEEYASIKCKGQREICFKRWKEASGFSNMPEVIKRAIEYAPSPE